MKTVILKTNFVIVVAAMMLIVGLMLPKTAGAAGKSEVAMASKPGSSTIVQLVLANDGEFDVLQAAVVKAGLVDALNGKKQYTVFAPTDAGFVKTLDVADEAAAIAKINSLSSGEVANILTYHVMSGRHSSTSVLARNSYRMLNGNTLTKSEIADAVIVKTDMSASNGVIHIIDGVLLPN